jgi:hypothetical protein
MKKLIVILFMVLLGSSTLIGQTTTGYVTVNWTNCSACCLGMAYAPCITVVRDYDDYVVTLNTCDTLYNVNTRQFSFDMPECTSNWAFTVYTEVWAGCDGGPLCCHQKKNNTYRLCGIGKWSDSIHYFLIFNNEAVYQAKNLIYPFNYSIKNVQSI